MTKLNKKNPDLSTLAGRLLLCMNKVGGKGQLADLTGISEAQLFRYINDLTDLPSQKLSAIAQAAGVHPGWVLTGQEEAPKKSRPPFRPELMKFTSRILDEFLIEYQRSFTPSVKSHLLTLLYEALRHEEVLSGEEALPNKFQILSVLSFMEAFKTEEQFNLYHEAMNILEYTNQNPREQLQLFKTFVGLIVQGYESYYDSYAGRAYYDRVGQSLLESTEETTLAFIQLALDTLRRPDLSLLDLGCGNGRGLAFIHQHFSKLKLMGVDISKQAIELAKNLEMSGKLPEGTIKKGDCTVLPCHDRSMDMVYSQYSLHYLPYLPGTGIGLEMAWKEIHRVLKPEGLVLLSIPSGQGRSYSQFVQFITLEDVETLAAEHGFKVVSHSTEDFIPAGTDKSVRACMPSLRLSLDVILQKIK